MVGAVPGGGRASNTAQLIITYNICVQYDPTQVHKLGSTIPIKLQLCDAAGTNVSSVNVVVHAIFEQLVSGAVTGVPVLDSGNANPDNNDFRFDAGMYIFNPKTSDLTSSGTWALVFQAGSDPAFHQAQFQIR